MAKLMKVADSKTIIEKSNLLGVFFICALVLTSTLSFSCQNVQAQSTKFKISGYILDSNGHGIAGADVIFNVPSIVPGVITSNSGYYETYGPSGTYHLNVWPPFDSNYIDYDQPGFVVASDVTKNITLNTGFKVSGYITDNSGTPVTGACIFLNGYGSGWFSTSSGYYFVAVPAGTYTINAHPRVGTYQSPTTSFPTYYECDFTVNSDTTKNIIVGNSSPTPTPSSGLPRFKITGYVTDSNGSGIANANIIFNVPSTVPSVWTDRSGYYEMFAPAGTYHVNVWPPYDSSYIDYDQPGFVVTSDITKNITLFTGYKVSGYISDYSGTPIIGAAVLLNNYGSGWFSNNSGYYFLNVPSGIYTINAHPRTGYNYSGPTSNFPTYYEYNFTVNGDTIKNITVGSLAATPTSTPTFTMTSTPTQKPDSPPVPIGTPAPTPQPNITPTSIPTQPSTPVPAFALRPAEDQANDNSIQSWIVLILIMAACIVAAVSLVRIFGDKTTAEREQ